MGDLRRALRLTTPLQIEVDLRAGLPGRHPFPMALQDDLRGVRLRLANQLGGEHVHQPAHGLLELGGVAIDALQTALDLGALLLFAAERRGELQHGLGFSGRGAARQAEGRDGLRPARPPGGQRGFSVRALPHRTGPVLGEGRRLPQERRPTRRRGLARLRRPGRPLAKRDQRHGWVEHQTGQIAHRGGELHARAPNPIAQPGSFQDYAFESPGQLGGLAKPAQPGAHVIRAPRSHAQPGPQRLPPQVCRASPAAEVLSLRLRICDQPGDLPTVHVQRRRAGHPIGLAQQTIRGLVGLRHRLFERRDPHGPARAAHCKP